MTTYADAQVLLSDLSLDDLRILRQHLTELPQPNERDHRVVVERALRRRTEQHQALIVGLQKGEVR